IEAFEHAVDDALARLEPWRGVSAAHLGAGAAGGGEVDPHAELVLARARVVASDPYRVDDATRAYRAVLDDPHVGRAYQAAPLPAFDPLLAGYPASPRRKADRRWLLEWRAEHAPEEERVARLLEWARQEELSFADPVHALALHRRVLSLDPECDEALSAVARLALETGDTEQALAALRGRRDRAEGPTRIAIELEIAQVLLAGTTRWREALASLRAVLAEAPNDAAARSPAAP